MLWTIKDHFSVNMADIMALNLQLKKKSRLLCINTVFSMCPLALSLAESSGQGKKKKKKENRENQSKNTIWLTAYEQVTAKV